MLANFIHSPAFHGALLGWATAARIDFKAFRSWKSFTEAKQYNWNVALWNWFEGIVYGALGGLGLQQWLS